jgi:ABC-2 type transport system permease protein
VTTTDDVRSSPANAWLLVARREIMVKVTDRAFLIGTLVTVAIIIGVIVAQGLFAGRTQDVTLVTTPEASQLAAVVQQVADTDDDLAITVREVDDQAAARAEITTEAADAWLHQEDDVWTLTTKSEPESTLEGLVALVVRQQVLATNAAEVGTSIEALEEGTTLETSFLDGDTARAELAAIVGFAFAFLFYIASLIFGITLANSVVEEKQSRVAEIIATAIPLRHLLMGKILGNTVLAVSQLVLYAVVGLIGLAFTDYRDLVAEISGPVVWFIVFFLAGFTLLACLWAVAGSLASRTEDVQSTSVPLTMLVMAILFGALTLDGNWQAVGSFVPPLSAVIMPIRLLEGDATWWEGVIALGLLIAATFGTVRICERIYRRSLLQTGGQVSLRKAWRAED